MGVQGLAPVLRAMVLLLLSVPVVLGQPPVDHKTFITRLGAEADAFERTAYRIGGRETLTQTVPNGVRIVRNLRGVYTKLPGYTREIVSEYGYVSVDMRGGSLREVRRVLLIDGQRWNKDSRSLKTLARDLAAGDDKARQRSLERMEEFGLNGFVSDLGQLILLFARGGALRYEFQFEKVEEDGTVAFTYQQLDGPEAVTVYGETPQPIRQKLKGHIWVQQTSGLPLRISLESTRESEGQFLRDRSVVEYAQSSYGILLPLHIRHQQHSGATLLVTDEFDYSGWKQFIAPAATRTAAR
ncbi:MAG: hypothetical protein H7039_18860 [Bryobacteraceae bacterium]|nr:hypothetical protein [Bryobacteraceae bacterium]